MPRLRTSNISDKQKTQLKICGFTRAEDLRAAYAYGIDWFGINFYPGSKRYVSPTHAAELLLKADLEHTRVSSINSAPASGLAGIFVDPDDALLGAVLREVPNLRVVQLHGHESPARLAQIRRMLASHQRIWKALHVASVADIAASQGYEGLSDLILFDSAQIAAGHTVPGGSGRTFSWETLRAYEGSLPYGLAGGINCENIQEALAFRLNGKSALLIDVASGAENGIPGIKDIAKIRAMVTAVNETS